MQDILRKVTQAFGVSGNEEEIRKVITSEIEKYVDEIKIDAMGNLIAVKKGKSSAKSGGAFPGRKIMLAAHMDEIGVIATFIDEKGFIRFSNLGGVSAFNSLAQRVRFKNGTIGCINAEEQLEDYKNLKLEKMYIDIGCKSREEAEKLVRIGDAANFTGDFYVNGDRMISKAMDDRSGCAVLIEVIKAQPKTDNEVYYVFTTQEEVGLRGAKTAAFGIMPDCAIAVDVTFSGDTPQCRSREVKLGAGPAIKVKDSAYIAHPQIRRELEELAGSNNIPYTLELLDRGGSDPGAIQAAGAGVPCGGVSIPCRYTHSPAEMVSMEDLKNCVKLVELFIKK
ncbi:endoglucanase [Ruminiclostridium sufflavum DSM 19573]|uniref:Endoglucanase n=1 Tax=Ruminiclostridium sufflavum DSM 19573 TaxID=1121337 RepID=A0A318XKI4_9FIRM|nr:M42 family metallopeptidase [Ruminiclostridium sufflavum]PYG87604.1 endoglucanase [Ruminiclostridium sufflavum DSM 19573]